MWPLAFIFSLRLVSIIERKSGERLCAALLMKWLNVPLKPQKERKIFVLRSPYDVRISDTSCTGSADSAFISSIA